jgi:endonuclease G, mitochondrial
MDDSSGNGPRKLPNVTERPYTRFPPTNVVPPEREQLTREEKDEREQDKGIELQQKEEWENLVKALRLHRRELLRFPGVTAVDIGYRIREHEFRDELALRVHVERKLKPIYFENRKYDEIPKTVEIKKGDEVINVDVDVMEGDYKLVQLTQPPRPRSILETPQPKANRRRRLDPLVGGISIGSPHTPAGTLGALVWDKVDGSVCILSNWHVLAGDLNAETGNPCFQPGLFDQGTSNDVVARLKRWSFNRQTDAAIAELNGSRHYCAGEIVSLFQQISNVAKPHLGMKILKSGRSTGFTWGFVDGLYFSSAIEYSHGIVRVFEEQIHIAPLPYVDPTKPVPRISEPGDSGSVWVTETNGEGYRAVGLHFAGDLPHSAFGEYALANPMTIVAERLNISFRPLFLEIRDEDVVSRPTVQSQRRGTGIEPGGPIAGGTLTGSGGQPDPVEIIPTGRPS